MESYIDDSAMLSSPIPPANRHNGGTDLSTAIMPPPPVSSSSQAAAMSSSAVGSRPLTPNSRRGTPHMSHVTSQHNTPPAASNNNSREGSATSRKSDTESNGEGEKRDHISSRVASTSSLKSAQQDQPATAGNRVSFHDPATTTADNALGRVNSRTASSLSAAAAAASPTNLTSQQMPVPHPILRGSYVSTDPSAIARATNFGGKDTSFQHHPPQQHQSASSSAQHTVNASSPPPLVQPPTPKPLKDVPMESLVFPNYALYQRLLEQQKELELLKEQLANSHEREQSFVSITAGLQQLVATKNNAIAALEEDRERLKGTIADQNVQIQSLALQVGGLREELEEVYTTVDWAKHVKRNRGNEAPQQTNLYRQNLSNYRTY